MYPRGLIFEDGCEGAPFIKMLVIHDDGITLVPYELGGYFHVHANVTSYRGAGTPLTFIVVLSLIHDRTIRTHLVVSVPVATLMQRGHEGRKTSVLKESE
jgi:hypothetical protein